MGDYLYGSTFSCAVNVPLHPIEIDEMAVMTGVLPQFWMELASHASVLGGKMG
jgi:hypothetical protein